MDFILQWIDALWLVVALAVVHRQHRWLVLGFMAACMIMVRLQTELMIVAGYPRGILRFIESDVFSRGLITYSIFYALYLILAYYSPGTKGPIFMAASISIFFMALFVSTVVMVL